MWAGGGAVAVARPGRQRAPAPNAQRTQIHPDRHRLLLQVGGSRPCGVLPAFGRGQARRRHRRSFWVPGQNPVQAASRRRPEGE